MNGMRVVLAILVCIATSIVLAEDAKTDVPEDLRVTGPEVATVHATGVQIYTCVADPSGKLGWTLKAPEATFENAAGLKGKHYVGPMWEAADGSKVKGRKLKEHASPLPDAVAWLLLEASDHAGAGQLANVSFIQRIHTTGGKPPAVRGAKAGDEVRIPYTADYVFYGPGATTQPVKP
jgi:hypothetical protein